MNINSIKMQQIVNATRKECKNERNRNIELE